MNRAVFDASVLVKLVTPEAGDARAWDIYKACDEPIAPDWAMLECGQALWKKARRGEYQPAVMADAYEHLSRAALTLRPASSLARHAVMLALKCGHSVYDCLYAVLALAEAVPLVTADGRLRDVAGALGVEVVWVDTSAG